MKCFYFMGKSSAGKDTIFKRILEEIPELSPLVTHTTRPKREGEQDGKEYYFDTEEEYDILRKSNKIIEERTYKVFVNGGDSYWHYYTVNDCQFQKTSNIAGIGTLQSYKEMVSYFGEDCILPIFIDIADDGIRLQRALNREMSQKNPNYAELCRRFLKDQEDFSSKNLNDAKICKIFYNTELDSCVSQIKEFILSNLFN